MLLSIGSNSESEEEERPIPKEPLYLNELVPKSVYESFSDD